MLHVVFFAVWILLNMNWLPGWKPPMFDPFPFGLLTMVVSLEAIILSVFVLLSQNRQVAKDRIRGDIEYEVNLKAELEIAQLHEKMDRLHEASLFRLESDPQVRGARRGPPPPLTVTPLSRRRGNGGNGASVKGGEIPHLRPSSRARS